MARKVALRVAKAPESDGAAELTDDLRGQIAAINKSQAVIEFSLDGKILTANENFLRVMGYTLDEIRGQHHSMFVDPAFRQSTDYRLFWDKLGRGEYDAGQYRRFAKGGREVWVQASYNPIMDRRGRPVKIVKYATDITEQKRFALEAAFKSAAFLSLLRCNDDGRPRSQGAVCQRSDAPPDERQSFGLSIDLAGIQPCSDGRHLHRHVPQEPGASAGNFVRSEPITMADRYQRWRSAFRAECQRRVRRTEKLYRKRSGMGERHPGTPQ